MYIDGRGFEIFGYFVNWYGVIIAFGMAMGVLLALKLAKKQGLKAENIIDLALICIPCAIVGARLYYVIFYEHDYSFWEIFKIWEGGLAIYGGVIGGVIGLAIYCYVKKLNFLKVADCLVPCLILGQAIGRWGNFTNHEAYGRLITDSSWQFFPFGVLIESNNFTSEAREAVLNAFGSVPSEAWFMATFFYESLWNFMVLGLLLVLFYRSNVKGLTMCGYFVLYGLGRVWIEGLRMDSLYFLGLKVSQWLSLILIIAFASFAIYLIYKARKNNQQIFVPRKAKAGVVSENLNASQIMNDNQIDKTSEAEENEKTDEQGKIEDKKESKLEKLIKEKGKKKSKNNANKNAKSNVLKAQELGKINAEGKQKTPKNGGENAGKKSENKAKTTAKNAKK